MALFRTRTAPILFCALACTALSACSSVENSPEYLEAKTLKDQRQYEQAVHRYGALYSENPDSVVLAKELAVIERKVGNPGVALSIMKDMHEKHPDDQDITMQLGYAMIETGQTEDAVLIFDEILNNEPENIAAYSGKAIAFDKGGNHLAAQDIYLKALSVDPSSTTISNNLAMSLILNGEPDEAIKLLQPIYEQNKSNVTIRQNLALAYGLTGQQEQALELNLKDLTPEQAHENIRFYEKHLAEYKKKHSKSSSKGIGFSNTSPSVKAKLPPPVKPVVKPAEPLVQTEPVAAPTTAKVEKVEAAPIEQPAVEKKIEEKPVEKKAPVAKAAPKPEKPKAKVEDKPLNPITNEPDLMAEIMKDIGEDNGLVLESGNGLGSTQLRTSGE